MIVKELVQNGNVRVTFSMPAGIWADTVYLVGDFNGWNPTATPMQQYDKMWCATVELAAGHSYQYRYLVNGTDWYNDWRADAYEPNELGGDNSVVVLLPETELVTLPYDTAVFDSPEDHHALTLAQVWGYRPRQLVPLTPVVY